MNWKKIKYALWHVDIIWSLPVLFGAFMAFEYVIHAMGIPAGTYDAGWFQPLLLAMAIVVGATNGATGGLFFTFPDLYRYLFKKDPYNSAAADFRSIAPIQRLMLAISALLVFAVLIILVFIQFV